MTKKVSIADLKLARWNPKSRTTLHIKQLAASIERVGLLVPILITDENHVIDGHRRIAACKLLGWTDVPVIVAAGDAAELYAEVNVQKKALAGNETLQVFLKEPNAVNKMTRTRILEIEEKLGKPMLLRLAKEGFSVSTFAIAKRIAHEAEREDMLPQIMNWLMKYRCSQIVRRALGAGTAPSKLIAAVKNDRPLKVAYASA